MNLYINLDDQYNVNRMVKALGERIGLPNEMHFYAQNNEILISDSLQFGFGKTMSAGFKRNLPFKYHTYSMIPVKDLHELLTGLLNKQVPESDIIKQSPPYYGNNVVNVGKMMDRKEWLSESWSSGLKSFAVQDLIDSLKKVGYTRDIEHFLGKKIDQRTAAFTHHDNIELVNGAKVGCKFHFALDEKEGGYVMRGYDLRLFGNTSIEHRIINGVDTWELEMQMKAMDWQYGIAETSSGMLKGYKDHEKINEALNRLGQDEQGAIIAMQLWNNHVPPNVLSKPEYIIQAEEKTGLYPKATFSGETTLLEASLPLQKILFKSGDLGSVNDYEMLERNIHSDVTFDAAGLEKLGERMRRADWTYDYSDDPFVWRKGEAEISGIKKDLETLCKEPGGVAIANALWEQCVPKFTVARPDFMSKGMSTLSSLSESAKTSTVFKNFLRSISPLKQKAAKEDSKSDIDKSTKKEKQRNKRKLE